MSYTVTYIKNDLEDLVSIIELEKVACSKVVTDEDFQRQELVDQPFQWSLEKFRSYGGLLAVCVHNKLWVGVIGYVRDKEKKQVVVDKLTAIPNVDHYKNIIKTLLDYQENKNKETFNKMVVRVNHFDDSLIFALRDLGYLAKRVEGRDKDTYIFEKEMK